MSRLGSVPVGADFELQNETRLRV